SGMLPLLRALGEAASLFLGCEHGLVLGGDDLGEAAGGLGPVAEQVGGDRRAGGAGVAQQQVVHQVDVRGAELAEVGPRGGGASLVEAPHVGDAAGPAGREVAAGGAG